ncbi:hypothetical protein KKE03_03220 [Patescibacteria group bacterium]|nr:hypothetical protein [Patescibacteria group bacterium]
MGFYSKKVLIIFYSLFFILLSVSWGYAKFSTLGGIFVAAFLVDLLLFIIILYANNKLLKFVSLSLITIISLPICYYALIAAAFANWPPISPDNSTSLFRFFPNILAFTYLSFPIFAIFRPNR